MESRSPIRVMQVIARMNVGGPAVLVADLMRNFDPALVNAVLVTGYCDENEADYLDQVARDVHAVRLPGLGRSISIIKDLNAFFLLIREIRRFDPDLIHTHTSKAGVLGRLAGLVAAPQAKRVHTFHGHLLHGYFGKSKTRIVVIVEKFLAKKTDKLITIGNQVKIDLLKMGVGFESKFEMIFPGLQPFAIEPKLEARKKLGLNHETTYLAFIGRITQIKRPDRLIEVARGLKNNQVNAHILIAGEGELFLKTKNIAEAEELPMTFLGWRNDIQLILSASNIAILCSDNEGIPLTLIQAAQAGLPIVSTNVGSISDIVINGKTGLLTELSASALLDAITRLLADPSLCGKFGKAGQDRANKYFTSEAMVNHHERLYSQLV